MTFNGWFQIALFSVVIVLLVVWALHAFGIH